ncbi:hypothetical protein ACFWQL_25310 [Amycolatopsis thermoflava]|uniref:hypothetical protein n=1 Tax=Amycolatopsis thermoflava TaxID=84480 RepID=UPI003647C02F
MPRFAGPGWARSTAPTAGPSLPPAQKSRTGLTALRHGLERWGGRGNPAALAAEAVPLPVRVPVVARDAELWHRRAGYSRGSPSA